MLFRARVELKPAHGRTLTTKVIFKGYFDPTFVAQITQSLVHILGNEGLSGQQSTADAVNITV